MTHRATKAEREAQRVRVLTNVLANPLKTTAEIAEALGITAGDAKTRLCELERMGAIGRQRMDNLSGRPARWIESQPAATTLIPPGPSPTMQDALDAGNAMKEAWNNAFFGGHGAAAPEPTPQPVGTLDIDKLRAHLETLRIYLDKTAKEHWTPEREALRRSGMALEAELEGLG